MTGKSPSPWKIMCLGVAAFTINPPLTSQNLNLVSIIRSQLLVGGITPPKYLTIPSTKYPNTKLPIQVLPPVRG